MTRDDALEVILNAVKTLGWQLLSFEAADGDPQGVAIGPPDFLRRLLDRLGQEELQ